MDWGLLKQHSQIKVPKWFVSKCGFIISDGFVPFQGMVLVPVAWGTKAIDRLHATHQVTINMLARTPGSVSLLGYRL